METRAILAFVLSLFVFVGWNYLLSSRYEREQGRLASRQGERKDARPKSAEGLRRQEPPIPHPPRSTTRIPSPPPALTGGTPVRPDLHSQPDKAAREVSVILRNSRIIFTTAGAGIRSCILKKYQGPKGEPLELIKAPAEDIPSPKIVLDDSALTRFIGLSNYEPSAEKLVLTEANPQGSLIFRLKDPSGLEVAKEYSFQFDSYMVRCKVKINYGNRSLKTLRINWNHGIQSGRTGKDLYGYEGPTTLVGTDRITDKKKIKDGPVRHKGDLKWTAYQNKYFAIALIPAEKHAAAWIEQGKSGMASVSLEYGTDHFPVRKEYSFFLGPKETGRLRRFKEVSLERLIDYGWYGNLFAFMVKPLFQFLQFFYSLTGNYGWSIIILTVVIKLLFFPLTHKSFQSMNNMKKIQPEIKILQERYKDDRQMMSQEMMRIYRENKVNPLGGCLPMLLQIPVFIALYRVLLYSIELRNAPFIFWITDLSSKDPYYITPIVMGGTMFLQQRMTPSAGDPTQQKVMMFLPLIFTFMFLKFPSGLVIYWLVNNLLTIAQQYYITRHS